MTRVFGAHTVRPRSPPRPPAPPGEGPEAPDAPDVAVTRVADIHLDALAAVGEVQRDLLARPPVAARPAHDDEQHLPAQRGNIWCVLPCRPCASSPTCSLPAARAAAARGAVAAQPNTLLSWVPCQGVATAGGSARRQTARDAGSQTHAPQVSAAHGERVQQHPGSRWSRRKL